jgi:hypothetical protein
MRGPAGGFSIERLMDFVTAPGQDVENHNEGYAQASWELSVVLT